MLLLPGKFWVLSVICMVYYSAVFPFVSLGQVFLVKKFDYSLGEANFVISERPSSDDQLFVLQYLLLMSLLF